MSRSLLLPLLLLTPALLAADGHRGHHGDGGDDATVHRRFDDVEKWSARFDDPARDAWQKPTELVAALGVESGATVADIGAGTGYLNPHLAKAVGEGGKLIAVDVETTLVEHMTQRAIEEGTPQVEVRLGTFDDPKLAAAEVDLVVLLDTYHHISGRVDYFRRLRAALKPGGRLAIFDWAQGDFPEGPRDDHKIPPHKVTAELKQAGWVQVEALPDELLPYQFGLVFSVAD